MSMLAVKLFRNGWLYETMLLLTIAGLGVSAYLMWGYTVPGAMLACGSSHGCETVKNSPYASLAGLPLPLLGLAAYLLVLILVLLQGPLRTRYRDWQPHFALTLFGILLSGMLYSAYLTYLELFVIYAICRWCLTSAIIMTALFALSVFNLYKVNSRVI